MLETLIYGPETRDESIARVCSDAGRVAIGEQIKLHTTEIESRDYQIEAWDAILSARQDAERSALLHIATGLGKTTIGVVDALRFIKEHKTLSDKPLRILFASHRNEINEQAAERFSQFAPALSQNTYVEGSLDSEADITFATMQSLHKYSDRLPADTFDYIIYDEAHHAQAETFKSVVQHFEPVFQLALTATPDRMDEENIRELFGKEIYSKPLAVAMQEGYLANVDYHIVFDDAVKQAMEEGFNTDSLEAIRQLLKNESRNEEIAAQILEERQRIGLESAKTIIFCHDISQANEMAALLNGSAYHSQIPKNKRTELLSKFRGRNSTNLLTTRDMFNEGVDIPDARLIVFLRSTGSQTVFEQQLGRGLRKYPGKDVVTVLDFVANIERLEQIKKLTDEAKRQRHPEDGNSGGRDSGLNIHTPYTDFDFDKISVELIERITALRREPYPDWSDVQTIEDAAELWQATFGERQATFELIEKASSIRAYISGSRLQSLGGIRLLNKTLGFNVFDYSSIKSMEDLAILWEENFPGVRPEKSLIKELSSTKKFVSLSVVSRLGGTSKLIEALGYPFVDYSSIESLEDVASLWQERYPDVKPTRRLIDEASKQGNFISSPKVREFGSIKDLQNMLGHQEKKIETIEDAAQVWQDIFPGVTPTKKLIAQASKEQRFVSSTYLQKLGGLASFKTALGLESMPDRVEIDEVESIDQLAEIWKNIFSDTVPTKGLITEASKKNSFVSYDTVKQFGGTAALKEALGIKINHGIKPSDISSTEDIARLWIERMGDLPIKIDTLNAASREGTFVSSNVVYKYGDFTKLKAAIESLKNLD